MATNSTIGARVRYWRRRRGGMTQAILAGLAGVSQSYISQVEAGHKTIERRSTLVAVAGALQVTVADLLGQPGDPTDPLKAGAARSVPEIRAAIIEIEEGDRRPPTRGGAEMAQLADQVQGLRAISDYGTMAPLLASYLREAASFGGIALLRAGYETSVCLRNLGYRDLALPAARIAVAAADEADDPGWRGAAAFIHTLAMPIEAAATTSRIAERSLVSLQQAAADPQARQMLGQIHLSASLACAVAGRTTDAAAHLGEARAEAATLGDPLDGKGHNLCAFGPTNVEVWRMNVLIELGEYGEVLALAKKITPGPLRVANRHASYWQSLGRALAHSGKTDKQALMALTNAERAAPLAFSLNAAVQDAVVAMVHRARRKSISDELRIMARRLGVDVDA